MSGAILETYVFGEILKSYWHNGKTPNIYFYKDADQREIDFVIEQNGILYPAEVKKTATPSLTATKSFNVLNSLKKEVGAGAVISACAKKTFRSLAKLWLFLLAICKAYLFMKR